VSSVGSFFSYVNDARSPEPKHYSVFWVTRAKTHLQHLNFMLILEIVQEFQI